MSVTTERDQGARIIYDAMNAEPNWPGAGSRSPLWWGELASSVLVLTGSEPIEYVTLRSPQREAQTSLREIEGLVFTDRLLVHFKGEAELGEDDLPTVSVRAVALSGLRALKVWSTADTHNNFGGALWPGNVHAVLDLETVDEPVIIPLRLPRNQDERQPLQDLVLKLPTYL